jgi:DNA-binding transcriptional ArsR family regulator
MPDRREAAPSDNFTRLPDEHFARLKVIAEARGLDPDRASAAANAALYSWRQDLERNGRLDRAGEYIPQLYAQLLPERVVDELTDEHFARLKAIAEARGLDPDQASAAANGALYCWRQDLARNGRLDQAGEYIPQLYGQVLPQRIIDEQRKKSRQAARAAPLEDAAKIERRDLSPERAAILHQLQEGLPRFFCQLNESSLGARFRELRRLARMHGCQTMSEQFLFIHNYLFENKAEKGDAARRDLTDALGWSEEKTASSLRRLRVSLTLAWEGARRSVFFGEPALPDAA